MCHHYCISLIFLWWLSSVMCMKRENGYPLAYEKNFLTLLHWSEKYEMMNTTVQLCILILQKTKKKWLRKEGKEAKGT